LAFISVYIGMENRLRKHVLELLEGGGAHPTAGDALADFPKELRGKRPEGFLHSAWQLLEHMRIAQWDILKYCIDPNHKSPEFPSGYWPAAETPSDDAAWEKSIEQFFIDLGAMRDLISDLNHDLLTPIPHAPDATLIEEAFLVANHNSYHTGQLVALRRALGIWKGDL
jgi:uncharacterized damage-inducible protein DinB